jgi:xylose isomerase
VTETDKRANFVRLAEGRTQVALEAIRKLGNLSNRRAYDFSDADIRKISKALREAVSDLEKRFGSQTDSENSFRL